jgi:N-acetylglucosaminyl-diphospho-decaprenol L-rhamnosyltransferase
MRSTCCPVRAPTNRFDVLLNVPPQSTVDWTLSIVSHEHGASVNRLLADLQRLLDPARYEVIVTVNCPEPVAVDGSLWPGVLVVRHNERTQGFARNHNCALAEASGRYVAVLDPDLRLHRNPFPALAEFLTQHPDALIAPQVCDSGGCEQDNIRRLVTPAALWRRYVLRRRCDYPDVQTPTPVDWIAGLFMAGCRDTFARQRGFDETFHLYCEDAELSLRYWNAGGAVWTYPFEGVIHDARRRTLVEMRHFLWHCESLLRLWTSRTFWRYQRGRR